MTDRPLATDGAIVAGLHWERRRHDHPTTITEDTQ